MFSYAYQTAGAAGHSCRRAGRALLRRGGSGCVLNESRFAHDFYMSWPWIKCARAYKASKGGLCERCWSKGLIVPGEEVHHKVRLTPENISDPSISLSWDNLELLCKNCHLEEHSKTRWRADEMGHVDL